MTKMTKPDVSAYNTTPIAAQIRQDGQILQLSSKYQTSLHRCPHCDSTKTFHKKRMETLEDEFKKTNKLYANTTKEEQTVLDNTLIYKKYDMCLHCGREWIMEIYCWEIIAPRSQIKYV